MTIRILLADHSEARLYGAANGYCLLEPNAELELTGRLSDSSERDRQLRTHQGEEHFARNISAVLKHAQRQAAFGVLALVAAPQFLGVLRAALSAPLQAAVSAEVHKNLLHASRTIILAEPATALQVGAEDSTAVGLSRY